MLQSLIGEVDAELLEAVVLVVFEAEDVEDADGQDLRRNGVGQNVQLFSEISVRVDFTDVLSTFCVCVLGDDDDSLGTLR